MVTIVDVMETLNLRSQSNAVCDAMGDALRVSEDSLGKILLAAGVTGASRANVVRELRRIPGASGGNTPAPDVSEVRLSTVESFVYLVL